MFFQMIDYSTTVFWVQTYNLIFAKPVESKEKALEVGEFVAHQLYDGTSLVNFDKYEEIPKVSDEGDTYIVYYRVPSKKCAISDHASLPEGELIERSKHTLGGGGPEIHIEKSTGKILEWKLAK